MSVTTRRSIYAAFTDPSLAEKAAGALLDHGVRAEHISILLPENYFTERRDGSDGGLAMEEAANKGITTTTAGDAASGSVKGAGIGLAAGALAALAAVFIPGVGLVLGGGALAMALGGMAGTTAAGAVAGGVTGFLKDQGIPDQEFVRYSDVLGEGGALIVVSATDENVDNADVESVLTKYGGTIASYPDRTGAFA